MKGKLQISILFLLVAVTVGGILALTYDANRPDEALPPAQAFPYTRQLVFANWASAEQPTREIIDRLLRDYEQTHPGVHITNLAIPFDQYEKQLIALAMGGQVPDVIQLSGNLPALLGAMGVLESLEDFVRQDDSLRTLPDDAMLEAGRYEGNLYAVPLALTPHGLWYNKSLMESAGLDPDQPPRTLEELERHLRIIQTRLPDVYGIGIDTTNIAYALTELWPYFQAFGATDLLSDPANPGFQSPETLDALMWLQKVVRNGNTPIGMQIKVQRELMAAGQIVYKLDGPYLDGFMRDINPALTPEMIDETFGVTSVPLAAADVPATAADVHNIGMSRQSGNKRLAWDFIRYMTTSDMSVRDYMLNLGMIPPLPATRERFADEMSRPHLQAFLDEVIPTAESMPYSPKFSMASQVILSGLQEVFRGTAPAEIAAQLDEALIELYREPPSVAP